MFYGPSLFFSCRQGLRLQRHKLGWEATFLAELIDLAKHFEKTLEKDKIQKANQFMALKL